MCLSSCYLRLKVKYKPAIFCRSQTRYVPMIDYQTVKPSKMENLTWYDSFDPPYSYMKIYKFLNISILKTCAQILCIFVGKGQGSTYSCNFCNGWYNHVLSYVCVSEEQIITFADHGSFCFNTRQFLINFPSLYMQLHDHCRCTSLFKGLRIRLAELLVNGCCSSEAHTCQLRYSVNSETHLFEISIIIKP